MPYEIRHFRPLYGRPHLDLPKGAPNVMRQGFGPASPEGRPNRRNMLIPKPRLRSEFIPALPIRELSWLAGNLGPAEGYRLTAAGPLSARAQAQAATLPLLPELGPVVHAAGLSFGQGTLTA